MGFGSGFSLRLPRPNFRSNLISDMQSVTEGRLGNANNSRLIQDFSNRFSGVTSITKNGAFVATVGDTVVGDETEKVGTPDTFEIG